jgi:phosphoribosyl-ATP pyrophosphohydrolase
MPDPSILDALSAVIAERKARGPEARSYVATLIQGGTSKIRAKIVEEAAEVFEAAAEPGEDGKSHLVREVADLVFHSLVMLSQRDLSWADVEAELTRRFGTSGIAEKESRQTPGP